MAPYHPWPTRTDLVVGNPLDGWPRGLAMASACSGMGTAELAWAELRRWGRAPEISGVRGIRGGRENATHVWASENNPACRRMLASTAPEAPILTDVTVRVFSQILPG